MSYQAPFIPNPDYDINAALADMHIRGHDHPLLSHAAQKAVKDMEDKYVHMVGVLKAQRDAAVKDAQRFHDENESLKEDVECQEILLLEMKKELEKKKKVAVEGSSLAGEEKLEEGEIVEKVVTIFVDVVPEMKEKMEKWAGFVQQAPLEHAPWRA